MSAKFLQALGDERPELHRQMGCMTGIFQVFDRQYLLTGRRLPGHAHRRLPSSRLSNAPSVGEAHEACLPQIVLEKNFSKSWNENHRVTMESSRTSLSSSSCSSFSSPECNGSAQQDLTSTTRMIFPERPLKNSWKLRSSCDSENALDHIDPLTKSPDLSSAQSDQPNLGIRNLVKDSIYRDSCCSSTKTTTKEEVNDHRFDYKDSPRPMQRSRSIYETSVNGGHGKSKVTMDINESLRVLAKLREVSRNSYEAGQQPRLSYDARDPFSRPLEKDAPRFSFDAKEATSKLREVPRLSLDIKEGSLWTSEMDLRPKSSTTSADVSSIKQAGNAASDAQQEQPASKRPPSVIAKLMGLEELHNLEVPSDYISNESKDDNKTSQLSKTYQERKQEPKLRPLDISLNEPAPEQPRNLDSTMRNAPNSRFPVETAPWKQQERILLPQKMPKGLKEAHVRKQHASVYSEIEKRLKDLEFQQSNSDLRALKHILDSMQAKGLLQSKKREEASTLKLDNESNNIKHKADASVRLNRNTSSKQMHVALTTSIEENEVERSFKSPIVIMKPSKSANLLSETDSSVIPLGGLSDLPQLRTSNSIDKRKGSVTKRIAKDRHPKFSPRVPAPQPLASSDRRSNRSEESSKQKSNALLMAEHLSRGQQLPRDNTGSSLKHTSSASPRLQKKLDAERRARPPTPPELTKNQRQSANRSTLDTVSPRSKLRRKATQARQSNDQLSGESGRTRSLNQHGNEMSTRSDSSISLASELDIEVTSADKSAEMNISHLQGIESPSGRNPQKVKISYDASKELSSIEHAPTTPDQPSPISVLDSSFDQEDVRPTRKASHASRADDEYHPSENSWKPTGAQNTKPTKPSTRFKNKKLANVEHLLQKLQQLNSNKDDDTPPVDHITFLCETQSPDHRYVSEILLASGLLMRDLSSGQTGLTQIQLHSSGYLINPDLFAVLEQRKLGWISKPEDIHQNRNHTRSDPKKAHRRLMFDMVNELLIQKFELETAFYHHPSPFSQTRDLPGKAPTGQLLVKELCSDIEELKTGRSICEENSSVIPDAEILQKLEGWTNFGPEVPGMVLEIERSIFKELVDEVMNGEFVNCLQDKAGRSRRKLFA